MTKNKTRHHTVRQGIVYSPDMSSSSVALENRHLVFETQRVVEIRFEGVTVGRHVLDLIVRQEIVVELKSVMRLTDTHFAQIRSYLKASGLPVGLLINFNEPTLRIRRFVN